MQQKMFLPPNKLEQTLCTSTQEYLRSNNDECKNGRILSRSWHLLLPATKTVPKEMLPLLDRPCIDYIVTEVADAGIERIIFVTASWKRCNDRNYFDSSPALEAHLKKHNKLSS